ncbi:MAG: hypothetical protein VB144_07570 [Clostridia bacterium]|nr:hypothetical protein [Clostridia bacterium]
MGYAVFLGAAAIMVNSWRYAAEAWKGRNRFGAVGLILFTLLTLALVGWELFFRA